MAKGKAFAPQLIAHVEEQSIIQGLVIQLGTCFVPELGLRPPAA